MHRPSETTIANMRPDELARWYGTATDPVLRRLAEGLDEVAAEASLARALLQEAQNSAADAEFQAGEAEQALARYRRERVRAFQEIDRFEERLARATFRGEPVRQEDVDAFLARLRPLLQSW